ncbi:MAG: DUF424 family protein [Thermoproteota archaeon]|nr:DUF424 family protein [Candidatus Brockarchaeota archaeon]MBO3768413.1 DUF424 family protein [Candidatus Brockarchaeota archaeon]MBO3801392.1 DUF424 family protein [Candidatus Brockarchaeota archaeon]
MGEDLVIAKRHEIGGIIIVGICDTDLLNKTIADKRGLRITIKESFYGKDPIPVEEVKRLLKDATSINAVGKKSVELVIKNGFGDERSVITIGDVPHLIFMKI